MLRLLLVLLLLPCAAAGQSTTTTTSATDGSTPPAIAPGSPVGSYSLSGFDNVNPFTRGLNFSLPLFAVGGRGSAGYTLTLPIGRKWRVEHEVENFNLNCERCDEQMVKHSYKPTDETWQDITPGFSPGVMLARRAGALPFGVTNVSGAQMYTETLTRLTFISPDGTESEFRDQLHAGEPKPAGTSRGTAFVTADGSASTFISDATVVDMTYTSDVAELPASGYLFLRDGTRYRISNGRVTSIRDRNGNETRFTYSGDSPAGPHGMLIKITDTLGRGITLDNGADGMSQHITYKGFGGATRTITVLYDYLENRLRPAGARRPAEELKTYGTLFPELANASRPETEGYFLSHYNPRVVSGVVLPGSTQTPLEYEFFYNSFGELARVKLPTGGAFEYDYQAHNGVIDNGGDVDSRQYEIFRQAAERRVYDGTALLSKTVFADCPAEPGVTCTQVTSLDPADPINPADTTDPAGRDVLLSRTRHYFSGSPAPTLFTGATHYSFWAIGKEFKTETTGSDGETVMSRVEREWAQKGPVSWWLNHNTRTRGPEPANDPRLLETKTTIEPSGANLVAKATAKHPTIQGNVGFDRYNNPTDVWEYDYGATPGEPGALLRHSQTAYLESAAYTEVGGSHLRGLPVRLSVFDAGGQERSRTTYEYDSYSAAQLVSREGISGYDSSFARAERGNVTKMTAHLLGVGHAYDSSTTRREYDVAGNVVRAVDAIGHATTFDFADCFGGPDDEARGKCSGVPDDEARGDVPRALGASQTFAFPTAVTNALGHSTFTQFDYHTGRAVNFEDANGTVASLSYDDPLDRLRRAEKAVNVPSLRSATTFEYDDVNRVIVTSSDREAFNDQGHGSALIYDGLGRTVESRQYESADNYIATMTEYDALGRAAKVSNPFRPWRADGPVWTETLYDALGRVAGVITPDGARFANDYAGNATTATDQAGVKRRSVFDALGRLTRVIEDQAPGGLNFSTSYEYDVLGNLRRVAQGGQERVFVYDSLGRLILLRQPEQAATLTDARAQGVWSARYTYDGNSNLKERSDARGITTSLDYDALNRLKIRSYSDSDATPAVTYTYDVAATPSSKAIGRLTSVSSSVSTTTYDEYDSLGRVKSSTQNTAGAAQAYTTRYEYNLDGSLASQTYPSGREVQTGYDAAGRVGEVYSQIGRDKRFYASSIAYAAHGAVSTMRLGGGSCPTQPCQGLWEHTDYNLRFQPVRIGVGSSQDRSDSGKLQLEYSYGVRVDGTLEVRRNNGNVEGQTIRLPGGQALTQSYTYDGLSRLESAREVSGATELWRQTYSYDRFGNRRFDASRTTLPAITPDNQVFLNPTVSGATNRLDGHSYDLAGNMSADAHGRSYEYDAENHQVSVDADPQTAGRDAAYWYDGDGRRVKKAANGVITLFVYDAAGQLIAEYENRQPTAGGASFIISDHLGSTRLVADDSGKVLARHDYLPFGEELYFARNAAQGYGVNSPRQKFTGYERDDETGLDFAQARYYSSSHGRFTTVDPLLESGNPASPKTWNRYAYALNNPLELVDPTGLFAQASTKVVTPPSLKEDVSTKHKLGRIGGEVVFIDLPRTVVDMKVKVAAEVYEITFNAVKERMLTDRHGDLFVTSETMATGRTHNNSNSTENGVALSIKDLGLSAKEVEERANGGHGTTTRGATGAALKEKLMEADAKQAAVLNNAANGIEGTTVTFSAFGGHRRRAKIDRSLAREIVNDAAHHARVRAIVDAMDSMDEKVRH